MVPLILIICGLDILFKFLRTKNIYHGREKRGKTRVEHQIVVRSQVDDRLRLSVSVAFHMKVLKFSSTKYCVCSNILNKSRSIFVLRRNKSNC